MRDGNFPDLRNKHPVNIKLELSFWKWTAMQPMRYSLIGKWVHCPLREEFLRWSRLQQILHCPFSPQHTFMSLSASANWNIPNTCVVSLSTTCPLPHTDSHGCPPTVHYWPPVHRFKCLNCKMIKWILISILFSI